jgi:KDO2-lipid IV(A) lauroyltransferase
MLPKAIVFFFAKALGLGLYYFDCRHRCVAYANLKTAFSDKTPRQLARLTRKFYQALAQNVAEIFLIPAIDAGYFAKYMDVRGAQNISEGFKKNKGIIFTTVHAGNWELSSLVCANLGVPFKLFVRQQRYPRLNDLLNSYRRQKKAVLIRMDDSMRLLLRALKDNEAIGMTLDQGGRDGINVKFFNRNASMSSGPIRLALRYSAPIVPVFYARKKGPYVKVLMGPLFAAEPSGDLEKDVRDNLQRLVNIFERQIRENPEEYLWTYKVWKYADQKTVLILNDAKAGHLRQAQAAAALLAQGLEEKGVKTQILTEEIKITGGLKKLGLALSACLASKYSCPGCLWCLRGSLRRNTYQSLVKIKPDIIVSCGAALAALNYVLSRENQAKSVCILRPGFLALKKFDLVIMPRHDHPPKRKNVVATEGALNLVNADYLRGQSEKLLSAVHSALSTVSLGLLIGGDAKNFHLDKEGLGQALCQVKAAAEYLKADILATTSRRTSGQIEDLVKEELKGFPACKLLVIANERNIPEAVGGILGLSQIVACSPESISMISEAASSGRYVLVFNLKGLNRKHKRFLDYFVSRGFIRLCEPGDLNNSIQEAWRNKPPVNALQDNLLIKEALRRLI